MTTTSNEKITYSVNETQDETFNSTQSEDNIKLNAENVEQQLHDVLAQLKAKEREAAAMAAELEAISKVQAIIEFTLDGKIITANDNFLMMFGYSLDEVKGQHHSLFVEDELKFSHEYKALWDKLKRGEFEDISFKRLGKNAKEIWIQATYSIITNSNNQPIKIIKFVTDITRQKLNHANFVGQIEAIGKSQAVIEFAIDGTIITANDKFLDSLGYSLSEIKGQHHSMFVEPGYEVSVEYKQLWAKLKRGEYDANEYMRIGKNGKKVWIQATYNPIFDLNGKPYKVVKYATDVTARKQAISQIKDVLVSLSQGDLTQYVEGDLDGEFSIIGDAMNVLIDILNNMVDDIRSSSHNVYHSAREIAAGNNELSHRTETQASNLEETASAMEELTSTVQQNSENATQASLLSSSVMERVVDGGDVVRNAIVAMSDIKKSSNKIADIISVIDEIAFQTNLLALNAAVEAARAGEQGRGFAVVAAEVRNLAQRSSAAAKEIKGLINDSVDAVGQGTQLVDATGATFNALAIAIESVNRMVDDIDNAGKEQSAGINEVCAAVSQMDDMTQKNAALVEEASVSSHSMEEEAQALLDKVEFFNSKSNEPELVVKRSSVRNKHAVQKTKVNQPVSSQAHKRPAQPLSNKTPRISRKLIKSDNEWDAF